MTNIDYSAKGQRRRIDYGNGVTTTYGYDPLTFRLIDIYTRRGAIFTEDCENPQQPPATIAAPETMPLGASCGLQNLHYCFDPVGNVIHIRDRAQQTIFFRNQRVEPSAEYRFDAVYRLLKATGREHLGQVGGTPIAHSHDDAPRVGVEWSANDGNVLGTYVEEYGYDAVGNLLEMRHRGSDPAHPGWTRTFAYEDTSAVEDGSDGTAKTGNRLSRTTVGADNPFIERYAYDGHGNVTRMPHLGGAHPAPNTHWDYADQLRQADLGGGGTAYYVYDAGGQRVRKVWEKSATLVEERIYFAGFEIFRRRQGEQRLERETLHIMDDERRVAMVETRTIDTAGTDAVPPQIVRYQLDNHLGSASIEVDDQAQLISYEEYTPYGSTSYQAVRSQTALAKRYRYTGKERDEESGLFYHGARYYVAWLGRWASCDPVPQTNLYAYGKNNPVRFMDPDGNSDEDAISGLLREMKEGYKASKPKLKEFVELFDVNKHHKQNAARFSPLGRTTESEHLIPRAAVEHLKTAAKRWYHNATTIVLDREISLNKTHRPGGDNAMSKAVKQGLMDAQEFLSRAKANAVRSVADHWAQTGRTTLKDVIKVGELTEVAQKEAGLLGKVIKGAGPIVTSTLKVVKPVAIALTLLAATEQTAHAAGAGDPVPLDDAEEMEQALEKAESGVQAVATLATLAPGPYGAIATGALVSLEVAREGIAATGGDQRIRDAGNGTEQYLTDSGWNPINAQTAGAVAAATTSIVEGVGVLGQVSAGPIGWATLGARMIWE